MPMLQASSSDPNPKKALVSAREVQRGVRAKKKDDSARVDSSHSQGRLGLCLDIAGSKSIHTKP